MNRSNKIVIDARQLGSKQSSGIGVMVQELVNHIIKIDCDNQYTIITSKQSSQLIPKDVSNLKVKVVDFPFYSIGEQLSYPRLLAKQGYDLIHYTNFNSPVFFRKAKSIVTVHDLIPWLFPSSCRQHNWLHQQLYRFVIKRSCQNASRVMAVSEGTKRDIIKYLGINSNKIDVIPEAVPARFLAKESASSSKKILAQYKITAPYFLYVGQWRRHKNLINLLRAFSIFSAQHGNTKLVIVGKPDPFAPEIMITIKQLGLESSVIVTGYVSDSEITVLYKQAKAFVFPSLYEGFGIPPLEAMSVGVPVLSSNASVMPEVLGDAALFFDPLDVNDIVRTMNEITTSSKTKKRLIEKGFEQVKKYSFSKMAKEVISMYYRVLGQ